MIVWEVLEALPPVNQGWASEEKSHGLHATRKLAERTKRELAAEHGGRSLRLKKHPVIVE